MKPAGEAKLQNNRTMAYLASIIAIILFGLSFLFLKLALAASGDHVFDVLSYRFLVSALAIFILRMTGVIRLDFARKNIRLLLLMCLLNPIFYFIFEIIGVSRTASSEAGMMLSVMPVVTIILSTALLKERITRRQVLFIALSLSGILLINVMSYQPGNSSNRGRFFLLVSIFAGSLYSVVSRRISASYTPIERTTAMTVSGMVSFTVIALTNHVADGTLGLYFSNLTHPGLLLPILYLGIGCSLIAFFLLNYSVTHLEVSKTSALTNLATVVSILAGVLILGEPFYWYHLVGSLIILLGVIGATRTVLP